MKTPVKRIAVYDLETGSKKAVETNPVTEIAIEIIDNETLTIIDEYETLIKPYMDKKFYDEDTAIYTNISYKDLEEKGKDSTTVVREIQKFAKKHTISSKKPILAGHNILEFDNPLLEMFLNKHKIKPESIFDFKNSIDSLLWARLKWLEAPNFELGTSCSRVGVTLRHAHRARIDATANAKMVIEFLKSLRGEGQKKDKKERFRTRFEI
jgi:DNA polymerase III alpha subunit (gram-positive type)